jgi:hypothetical protein
MRLKDGRLAVLISFEALPPLAFGQIPPGYFWQEEGGWFAIPGG